MHRFVLLLVALGGCVAAEEIGEMPLGKADAPQQEVLDGAVLVMEVPATCITADSKVSCWVDDGGARVAVAYDPDLIVYPSPRSGSEPPRPLTRREVVAARHSADSYLKAYLRSPIIDSRANVGFYAGNLTKCPNENCDGAQFVPETGTTIDGLTALLTNEVIRKATEHTAKEATDRGAKKAASTLLRAVHYGGLAFAWLEILQIPSDAAESKIDTGSFFKPIAVPIGMVLPGEEAPKKDDEFDAVGYPISTNKGRCTVFAVASNAQLPNAAIAALELKEDDRVAMTAAHCLKNVRDEMIRFEATTPQDGSEGWGYWRARVTAAVKPECYNDDKQAPVGCDIAFLRLQKPGGIGWLDKLKINHEKWPKRDFGYKLSASVVNSKGQSQPIVLSGWGSVWEGKRGRDARDSQVLFNLSTNQPEYSYYYLLRAKPPFWVCKGDSGGPLAQRDDANDMDGKPWETGPLIGLVHGGNLTHERCASTVGFFATLSNDNLSNMDWTNPNMAFAP